MPRKKKNAPASKASSSQEKITKKMERFADEYTVDFNGKQAAIRAGYSEGSASVSAHNLLHAEKYRHVQELINAKIDARNKEITADKKMVVEGLKGVYLRCIQSHPVLKFNPKTKQMEQVVEGDKAVYAFDSVGANRALELIGKELGMFDKKLNPTDDADLPPIPVNITIIQRTNEDDTSEVQKDGEGAAPNPLGSDPKASGGLQPVNE